MGRLQQRQPDAGGDDRKKNGRDKPGATAQHRSNVAESAAFTLFDRVGRIGVDRRSGGGHGTGAISPCWKDHGRFVHENLSRL